MTRPRIPSSLAVMMSLVVVGLLSCGASSQSASPTSPSAAAEDDNAPVVGPPQVAWKDLDQKQRGRYMAKVVMPTMAPLFKGFDATRYADFNCATCHGKGVENHTFKMPNPDIQTLPGPDRPDLFKPIYEKNPDMVAFMGSKVMPEMARLLGAEPFDYQNPKPEAFSCLGCHTKMQ